MEGRSRQNEPIGFAGLASLVTKLPEAPRPEAANRTEQRKPEREKPQPASSISSPPPTPRTGDDRRAKRALVWIAVVVGGPLIIIAMTSNNQKPQYTGSPAQYQQSAPTNLTSAADTKPTPSAPAYTPPSPPEIVEEKPDISGEPVLYRKQIYYCLVEKERINILRNHTDDTSGQQINFFNERVRDFNARCGNYKYYQREMDAAKRQYDAKIRTITAQFVASLTPASAPAAKPPQPSPSFNSLPPPMPIAPPAPPSSAATAPPVPARPAPSLPIIEAVPPYGQGHQHSREQLYYCFAESVRLDWAKKTIDMTSQSQVDALNGKLNDFNTRCTRFTSDAADRDAVKKQLASKRGALKAEGVAMAKSWR